MSFPQSSYILRAMTDEDISFGLRLSQMAGWNQTHEDWQLLLELPRGNHWVIEESNRVVATITTIAHGSILGWIGMVLVDSNHRRRGLATRLLKHVIDQNSFQALLLDATAEGIKVYEKLGFSTGDEYKRLILTSPQKTPPRPLAVSPAVALTTDNLPAVIHADLNFFGFDRSALLNRLFKAYPNRCWVVKDADKIQGYCFGRPGRNFAQIGPVIAVDTSVAEALVRSVRSAFDREPLVIDAHAHHKPFVQFLIKIGFVLQRSFVRMHKAPSSLRTSSNSVFASAGPELG